MDSLDVVEWQLRGGTVRLVRGFLGWLVGTVVAILVIEVALDFVVQKSGNGATAYFAWIGQALVIFTFVAGIIIVFAVQIYRYVAERKQ
ncbi:hypothetical protein DFJ73DRAFT_817099 [Zopfochytrium polystomum]|nr:hypothetical protein DFJ73DRAFT_817099 [Zopfochytrium polystomum]